LKTGGRPGGYPGEECIAFTDITSYRLWRLHHQQWLDVPQCGGFQVSPATIRARTCGSTDRPRHHQLQARASARCRLPCAAAGTADAAHSSTVEFGMMFRAPEAKQRPSRQASVSSQTVDLGTYPVPVEECRRWACSLEA
jgi:hypothetical protein